MLYDKDCFFCKKWIQVLENLNTKDVVYYGAQDFLSYFPKPAKKATSESIQLLEGQTVIAEGAKAAFYILGLNQSGLLKIPYNLYTKSTLFKKASEKAYQTVAKNRMLFSTFTRWFFGKGSLFPNYKYATVIFRVLLATVYGVIFFKSIPSLTIETFHLQALKENKEAIIAALGGLSVIGFLCLPYKKIASTLSISSYIVLMGFGKIPLLYKESQLILEAGILSICLSSTKNPGLARVGYYILTMRWILSVDMSYKLIAACLSLGLFLPKRIKRISGLILLGILAYNLYITKEIFFYTLLMSITVFAFDDEFMSMSVKK